MLRPLAGAVPAGNAAPPRAGARSSLAAGGQAGGVHRGGEKLGGKVRFPPQAMRYEVGGGQGIERNRAVRSVPLPPRSGARSAGLGPTAYYGVNWVIFTDRILTR